MSDLKFEMSEAKDPSEAKAILKGLVQFNDQYRIEDWKELTISVKDTTGKVIAGLNGHSDWGWLFVKLLWVDENYRSQSLGKQLMERAENEAKNRRCHSVWLDTFSFQAKGFYEKLGFSVFGELEDFPIGHKRFFMWRRLSTEPHQ